MTEKKTLQTREKELQMLMGTTQGRDELQSLADSYTAAGARPRPAKTSVITYILVHERGMGMIVD